MITDKEMLKPNQLIPILIEASKKEDWERIDNVLVPQLIQVNGNQMAKELLEYVEDKNPNVRDVVATSLSALTISDKEIQTKTIEAMAKMAASDNEVFPAGRAAVFLIKHQQERDDITKVLNDFKEKAADLKWQKELEENIPELEGFWNKNL